MSPLFALADLERANVEWGCNCGPATLAAICGLTLDEARRYFSARWPGYTNPTMMKAALTAAGKTYGVLWQTASMVWPIWGICRIQWEGPWMAPNVPAAARYQHTHWIGVSRLRLVDGTESATDVCIWDVNQLSDISLGGDGWAPLAWWRGQVAPRLTEAISRATGGWHITHAVEVGR